MKKVKNINLLILMMLNLMGIISKTVDIETKEQIELARSKKQKLNILFVLKSFPVLAETPALNQINSFIKNGHNVTIFAFREVKNITHPDVQKYNLLKKTYFKKIPPNLFDFDIVYCQFGPLGEFFVEMKAKYGFKAKIVTCFRGYDISRHILKHPEAYQNLFIEGSLFFPVCEFFKKKLISLGCDVKKIKVIHSPIDCKKFVYKNRIIKPNEPIVVITVGRLVEKKGIEYSIRAFAKLLKKYPNILYIIVGDGPLRKDLDNLIKQLKLEKNVSLLGSVTHKKLPKILHKSHIFVLASTTADSDGNQEGIPNVLKEAMATGLPVVSTYHAGISELVENNISGFLVPERNVDQLAEKLEYLIKHPEIWKNMGSFGSKKVNKEFNNNYIIKKIERMFHKILNNK